MLLVADVRVPKNSAESIHHQTLGSPDRYRTRQDIVFRKAKCQNEFRYLHRA